MVEPAPSPGLSHRDDGGAVAEEALVHGDARGGAVDLAVAGLAPQLPGELAHLGDRLGRDRFAEAREAPARVDRHAASDGGVAVVEQPLGLACFGEAVPAQAIAQVCELTWQLRGQAGDRQVEGATAGITVNQGLFGHGSSVIAVR
jgi:acetyl-CoA acetyltransferase